MSNAKSNIKMYGNYTLSGDVFVIPCRNAPVYRA